MRASGALAGAALEGCGSPVRVRCGAGRTRRRRCSLAARARGCLPGARPRPQRPFAASLGIPAESPDGSAPPQSAHAAFVAPLSLARIRVRPSPPRPAPRRVVRARAPSSLIGLRAGRAGLRNTAEAWTAQAAVPSRDWPRARLTRPGGVGTRKRDPLPTAIGPTSSSSPDWPACAVLAEWGGPRRGAAAGGQGREPSRARKMRAPVDCGECLKDSPRFRSAPPDPPAEHMEWPRHPPGSRAGAAPAPQGGGERGGVSPGRSRRRPLSRAQLACGTPRHGKW